MKYIRIFLFALFLIPSARAAQNGEFMTAAQLLAAAKNADIQQVQILINNGANVNFIDSTGLSIVCTALMNNDVRAAQILQMYGADASKCDVQIKEYKTKTKPKSNGGLFSGLSSAQTLSLAAAGAAVVVGGLLLLTDVFDPGNDNSYVQNGDGTRPGGDGNNNSGDGTTAGAAVPLGPAFITTSGNAVYNETVYQNNLNMWNPTTDNAGVRSWDFNFFRPNKGFTTGNYISAGITVPMRNYLLMMHGYSPFADGYLGQETHRNDTTKMPLKVNNSNYTGGRPIGVGLITANGINPVGSAGRGDGILYYASANADSQTALVDKYANFGTPDATSEKTGFDLSNSGTAMNPFVSPDDNALGKIVAGWEAGGRESGDLYGFVPNAQLAVYRTGGGYSWVQKETPNEIGTIAKGASNTDAAAVQVGDTITAGGKTYEVVAVQTSGVSNPFVEVNGVKFYVPGNSAMLVAKCKPATAESTECENVSDMAIYRGGDGLYYVNYSGQNRPDDVFEVTGGQLMSVREYTAGKVLNYTAMSLASRAAGVDVIANTANNPRAFELDYLKVDDMPGLIAVTTGQNAYNAFIGAVNSYYDVSGTTITESQGQIAHTLFNGYSNRYPMIVNSAGAFRFGTGAGESASVLDATFENYAPIIYPGTDSGGGLGGNFMTVVAVTSAKDMTGVDSIGKYGDGTAYGPLYLATWPGKVGDTDVVYQSRQCGVAGVGVNGVDPWCFAAAGATSEMATSAAAGAVAAIKGAFYYMSNKEIFNLLALTADGAYLGTNPATGLAWAANKTDAQNALAAYLQERFSLPPEYRIENLSGDKYLEAFARVYGYGLINLERATKPGGKIYYHNGNTIVSGDGNAYWRKAASTTFRSSSVFAPRGGTIRAPFFDVLESADGNLRLPRVWNNEFSLGVTDRHGLYMGDVLGDLRTRDAAPARQTVGHLGISLGVSEKMYADNLGGLDTLRLDFEQGNWTLAAGYQRYFTDGRSRFSGLGNPILNLATNAVVSDAEYVAGGWGVGARAFSGAITDEGLLDSDPTISAQFTPARLGLMQGMQSHVAWRGERLALTGAVGAVRETGTILGAQTGGLLDLGGGDTQYVDAQLRWAPRDNVTVTARATWARTTADATGDFILGMGTVRADALAIGMTAGNFDFAVSRPLAVTRGGLRYADADYDVVATDGGHYDLVLRDAGVRTLDLAPDKRELRFNASYRRAIGMWTDGALGLIYRVHPNNTDAFGDEAILMMKLTHRMGI